MGHHSRTTEPQQDKRPHRRFFRDGPIVFVLYDFGWSFFLELMMLYSNRSALGLFGDRLIPGHGQ